MSGVGAEAPTPITVQLAPQCVQVPDLVEISAFVRSDCNGSSFLVRDSPAEPKMVAGAAELVEYGRREPNVAFEHGGTLVGPRPQVFLQGGVTCTVSIRLLACVYVCVFIRS